jgi:hypothetical protein
VSFTPRLRGVRDQWLQLGGQASSLEAKSAVENGNKPVSGPNPGPQEIPQFVNRSLSLENPVSELRDNCRKFAGHTPDHVANFTLERTLPRDPEDKEWKATRNGAAVTTRETS